MLDCSFIMRKPLVLLCFFVSLVLLSCHNKTNSHRSAFSGSKQEIKHSQKETFTKKPVKSKSTNAFDKSRRRVTAKKVLFFFRKNKSEKETSTFSGGKTKKYFKFNVFNRKKKKTGHRNGLFKGKTEKHYKKKKIPEPELFDPKMRIHFKRL